MRRVDEAIRQVIGEVVAGELKDPRVGFVTVTDVRTSADLSHARVYVSVLGDESSREATLAGLRSAHGYMQRRVASELRLKRTPTLDFLYDDTTDRAMRLEALLAETGMRAEGECLPDSVETGTDWGDTRSARIPKSASAEGECLPASVEPGAGADE